MLARSPEEKSEAITNQLILVFQPHDPHDEQIIELSGRSSRISQSPFQLTNN